MGWQDLIQNDAAESMDYPWTGGRFLCVDGKTWRLSGNLPEEHGWARLSLCKRTATLTEGNIIEFDNSIIKRKVSGYLVGDRIVIDGVQANAEPGTIHRFSERVFLIDPGLDRFARISAGRTWDDGPLIFCNQEFPLGPEDLVLEAYLNQEELINNIKGVTPGLVAAFQLETWHRKEVERCRIELERLRQEEEEKRAREEKRKELTRKLGDGASRREMAKIDFATAARAALVMSNATYLDHRKSTAKGEMIVRYRLDGRRYECICDENSLRITDAGICLQAHYDDPDFEGGTKGDTWLTLESLPSVVAEAERTGRLVVYRHVY